MSFTDRKPFSVTPELHAAFTKRKFRRWNCSLCGHEFRVGDMGRWIYANDGKVVNCGNFFVCGKCDAPDEQVLAKAKESHDAAVKLAKQWGIYGPEWQDAAQYYDQLR